MPDDWEKTLDAFYAAKDGYRKTLLEHGRRPLQQAGSPENRAPGNRASESQASESQASENQASENQAPGTQTSENRVLENQVSEHQLPASRASKNRSAESHVSAQEKAHDIWFSGGEEATAALARLNKDFEDLMKEIKAQEKGSEETESKVKSKGKTEESEPKAKSKGKKK